MKRRPARVVGTEADHESVLQLLQRVFHAPTREAFQGTLADPFYRAEDRLLVKLGSRVVGHVHRTRRTARYGEARFDLGGLMWVATHPEYRRRDLTRDLVLGAEQRARAEGCALLVLTTTTPRYYRQLGWTVLGRHCFSEAPARNLPRCPQQPFSNVDQDEPPEPVVVQPWRHDRIDVLNMLYEQAYGTTTGTVVRSDRYWQWLIGREYAEDVWLAQQGEQPLGYAFARGENILEIAHAPSHPEALDALLARIRIEALDQGQDTARVYAPADHPVHSYFQCAGGQMTYRQSLKQTVFMAKVTDFATLLGAILLELEDRIREADLPRPVELGLIIDQFRCLLHFGRRSSQLQLGKTGRRYLRATPSAATRLIFGHNELGWLVEQEKIQPSNQAAIEIAEAVFPAQQFWQSPLETPIG